MWPVGYFEEMRERHMAFCKMFPNREETEGRPYAGISDLRPETKAKTERSESKLSINIAGYGYGRVSAIRDGKVSIEGADRVRRVVRSFYNELRRIEIRNF